MTTADVKDDELSELRQRRKKELLHPHANPPGAKPSSRAPVPLDGASIPTFLAAHPRSVIDVWAPWCAPCRAMAPTLDALAERLGPQVRFGKVNADQEPAWTTGWGVTGIPTLLLFERGRLVDRIVGAHPGGEIARRLRSTFGIGTERRSPAHPTGTESDATA